MRFNAVYSTGIDKIINGFLSTKNSKDRLVYGSKSTEFFENCEITLLISDLKGIELLVLKRFCSSVIVLQDNFTSAAAIGSEILKYQKVDESTPQKVRNVALRYIEEHKEFTSAVNSLHRYYREPNISNLFPSPLPCNTLRFKVLARFEGAGIMGLLDAFPESVLYLKKEGRFVDPNTKEFGNLIVQRFITNYFNFFRNKLKAVDVLTDVQFETEFGVRVDKDNPISCMYISTPIGNIEMGSVESFEDFESDMKKITGDMKYHNIKPEILKDSVIYHFAIYGSMEDLLVFMAYSNLVYHHDDLKTIAGTRSVYQTIENINTAKNVLEFSSYQKNIIDRVDKYRLDVAATIRKEEETTKTSNFNRIDIYEYIPRASMLKFYIHGTASQLNDFIDIVTSRELDAGYKFDKPMFETIANTILLTEKYFVNY